jgi:hypothetical protein
MTNENFMNTIERLFKYTVYICFCVVVGVLYWMKQTYIANDILFALAIFVLFMKLERMDEQIKRDIYGKMS